VCTCVHVHVHVCVHVHVYVCVHVFVCVCARARAETAEEAAERLDSAMKVCLGFWI